MGQEYKHNCVDYAREIFDTSVIRAGLYHERMMTTTLQISGCEVTPFFESASTHALVKLAYRNVNEVKSDFATNEERFREYLVFSSSTSLQYAFSGWRDEFKHKVFRNKIPLTVALDLKERILHIVTIDRESCLDFHMFAELTEQEVELITTDVSTDKPFKFDLDTGVLMDIIAGEEGFRHAYDNLLIQFNCTVPLVFKRNYDF